ncbi:MAG TPA: universal stress protein, partial [Streptosporangiaceae bacterium]|nr:universal stress protein [Streptosporangiaceae bacterium]
MDERNGGRRQGGESETGSGTGRITLSAAVGETVSVIALLAVLAWAVIRPRGWPEAIAAVPAAAILVAAGVIPASEAAAELLEAAARRLGRRCERVELHGQAERTVVAAAAGADLLIVARDGDRSRLGPKSLGKAVRFVVDHAACPVLLVWPEPPP